MKKLNEYGEADQRIGNEGIITQRPRERASREERNMTRRELWQGRNT